MRPTTKVAIRIAAVVARSASRERGASTAALGGGSLVLVVISSRLGWDIACRTAAGGFILDFGRRSQRDEAIAALPGAPLCFAATMSKNRPGETCLHNPT